MFACFKKLFHKESEPVVPMKKFEVKILYNNDEMLPYIIKDAIGKNEDEAAANAINIIADIGYFGMTPREKVIQRLKAVEITEVIQ